MPPPPSGLGPPPGRVGSGPGGIRPLNLGDVLDGMFRLLVSHWRAYLLGLGVIVAPVTLAVVWLEQRALGGAGLMELFTNPAAAEALASRTQGLAYNLAQVAGAANVLLVTPLTTGVSVAIAAGAFFGRRPSAGAALRTGLRRYPAMLGATILYGLVIIAMFLPGGALIAAGILDSVNVALIGAGAILAVIGLVPGFALYFLFALSTVAVVTERRGPVAALRRSWQLVRTRFWPVTGFLLLASIVAGLVGFVAGLPLQLPGQLLGGVIGYVLLAAGTILTGILTTPLAANASTLVYYDTRIRTEGMDLQLAADAMEQPRQAVTAWGTAPTGWDQPG